MINDRHHGKGASPATHTAQGLEADVDLQVVGAVVPARRGGAPRAEIDREALSNPYRLLT
ncbi:hypothetical protein [Streptomyces sp. NPDC001903]|uniref:hypothetical protein n=1 Tax=Streptomyces sp. NPDC001903 TaxID=3364622 RepID=UPI0036C23EE5